MAACPGCGMALHDGPCPRFPAGSTGRNLVLQGRYELIGLLGQGGMGTVYMGRDLRLHNRPCVVKKLRDDFYREEDKQKAVAFFKREAGVLSGLQHPTIVHILDYFEENYDYFLVMEYVEGSDLNAILRQRGEPFSERQVLDWAVEVCDVLEYLHEHEPPVIYRDLKPSNIMIDVKGRVKLVDFGIARPIEESTDNTHVVSAGYSPPEQYWGHADPRSDIYSLGGTMYFLLTGDDPLALHVSSPAALNPDVSARTDALVRRATAQDPGERFQSAAEMRQALLPEPEAAEPSRSGRLPEVMIGVGIVLVACVALLALLKFDEMVKARTATEEILTKQAREKNALDEKLKRYSKVMEAHDRAILEWRDQAVSRQQDKGGIPADQRAEMAAQIAGEADLTDPEGLKPLDGSGSDSSRLEKLLDSMQ